ncbi:MAG: right-handed parallel beta-helix repeat-containing protein [Chitinispirillaceae bacterium]|nr:right-handed parallel beta-helix repeat-containing protein [Chitinispirillaceae bacterium]
MSLRLIQIIIVVCTAVLAETDVGGILTRDTRWNADGNPYRLSEDLVVERYVRLTIAPGCRIIVSSSRPVDTTITQYDKMDMKYTSIKVYGTLICVGNWNKRTVFSPDTADVALPAWYGILLDGADDQFTEIGHTDITGAYNAVTIRRCSPLIHHTALERNHTGIFCMEHGSVRVYNCFIGYNTAAGIRFDGSNPVVRNSIIVFNRNNGVWCDSRSKIDFAYNCIFGNGDGDLLDCDPEIGLPAKKNKNGDSIDIFNNLRQNPVFTGSPADSTSRLNDLSVPTDEVRIKNRAIAAIIHEGAEDTAKSPPSPPPVQRYELSGYSPCRDAGDPSSKLKDTDGSRNDMGIYGGPAFIDRK